MSLLESTVTMYPKLERHEWIFGTAPDPKDTRIVELEKALHKIVSTCEHQQLFSQNKVRSVYMIARDALALQSEIEAISKGEQDGSTAVYA